MYKFNMPEDKKNCFFHIKKGSYRFMHTHNDYWEFMLVTSGSYIHNINDKKIKIEKNTLCIIRPNDIHSLKAVNEKQASHMNLGVKSEFLQSLFSFSQNPIYQNLLAEDEPSYILSEEEFNSFVKISEMILLSEQSAYNEALLLLLVNIFKVLLSSEIKTRKQEANYSSIVTKLLYLMNTPSNLALPLRELIALTNYSYPHVNRVFLQEIGVSLSDYFRQKKINYAKKLLSQTNYTLEIIAERTGYSGPYALSATFKKIVGVSPAQYAKKNKSSTMLDDFD